MDSASPRAKLSRIGLRYQHRTQNVPSINQQELESEEGEKAPLRASPDAPLLLREQRRRTVMGKDHRQFHRRAAQAAATRVLTVDVEVVLTVDTAGNLLTQETVTQSVPSLATAVAAAVTSGSTEPSTLAAVPLAISTDDPSAVAAVDSSVVAAVPLVLVASTSTALPLASTVLPSVSTDLPAVSTDLPAVSTDLPAVSTDLPAVSTDLPTVSTDLPKVLTIIPEVSTVSPEVSTVLPSVSTVLPSVSTVLPSVSTVLPSVSTDLPLVSSASAIVLSVPSVSTALLSVSSVLTALPSVPSVPAYPSNSLPSVPSVPAFPSDLTVPAYPYSSNVPVQAANVDTQSAISSLSTGAVGIAATPSPVAAPTSNSTSSTSNFISSPSNPSSSSSSSSSLSSASTLSSISTSLPLSQAASTNPQVFSTQSSFDSSGTVPIPSTSDSVIAFVAASSQATTTTTATTSSSSSSSSSSYYGGGGNNPTNTVGSPADATAASPAGTTSPAPAASTGDSSPLETPQVVGSVVGSLAGAALILMILLFLIKRHKRSKRSNGLVLTGDNTNDNGQSMRQAPTSSSLVPAAFLNRFSGMSRSTVETSATGEPSFQRVSGRKLPSAFSEGMTSGQFGRERGSLSGTSFYQDDHGVYGGPELSKEFGPGPSKEFGPRYSNDFDKEIGGPVVAGAAGKMNIRPGPARTPIIHHANDENPFETNTYNYRSTLSPPLSPNPDFPKRNTLGRSLASADGSRSSRFTENV